MYDISSVRQDFPFVEANPRLVYADNACMSLRPQSVIDAINHYYQDLSACAGRSNHRLARKVDEAVSEARSQVAKLINAKDSHQIVWTRNTSEAINLVAHSIGLRAGDVVITSDKEHNSNLIPWLKLKKNLGIVHHIVPTNNEGELNLEVFHQLLEDKVTLVSLVHTSNIDGVTFPIKEITMSAHRAGAKVMIDAAQSIPHQRINVQDLDIDFMAFSAHKMMGPSGMGVLYGKLEALEQLDSFLVGGDTVAYSRYDDYGMLPVPEKFEAGLQDYAGILGTGAAATYLMKLDPDNIHQHEIHLNKMISQEICQIPDIHILGPQDPAKRNGIISFNLKGVDPHQISLMLDEGSGIMVRSGQHCVHSWFHARNLTGSARVSLYAYNTEDEAIKIGEQIQLISEIV